MRSSIGWRLINGFGSTHGLCPPPPIKKMTKYQFYLLDGDGEIVKSDQIEADSDNQALGVAKRHFVEGHTLEIWKDERKIADVTENDLGNLPNLGR
jgi:hypothetical protein